MGTQAGREAVTASHPVLRQLIGYINEQQEKYLNKEHSDLFKYKSIWIPTELFKNIDTRYYSKKYNTDTKTKTLTFFVNNTYLIVHFKDNTHRDSDIEEIEEHLKEYQEMEKKLDNI